MRLALLCCVAALAVHARAADQVNAALSNSAITDPLPADFASFSIEVSSVIPTFEYPAGSGTARPSWVNLMKHLSAVANGGGPGVGPNIRVGGNSADLSAYVPEPAPLPVNDTYRITAADFQIYLAAVPLWNGSLTLGLNFRDGKDDTLALNHMKAALAYTSPTGAALAPLIQEVEVGNEVDLFGENGIREPSYSYNQYTQEFETYAESIMALGRKKFIQGATFCCKSQFVDELPAYAKTFSNPPALGTVSLHEYPLSHCNGRENTITELLADSSAAGRAATAKPLVAGVRALGLPFYIGEGNSISCGGESGISDTFAATLWSTDILLNMAAVGVTRWNFHGEPGGPYTTVAYANPTTEDSAEVKPLYYGLWAFNYLIANHARLYSATVTSSNPLIKVWQATDSKGQTRVMVIHKDITATEAADVTITLPPGVSLSGYASLLRLTPGPGGVSSSSGLSFAGLTYDNTTDGLPTGTLAPQSVPANSDHHGYSISVSPVSVVILDLPAS